MPYAETMQPGKRRGPKTLLVVILIGVLGYVVVQQSGGFDDAPHDASSAAASSSSGATDAAVNTAGGIPDRPGNAVAMTVDYVHDGDTLFLRTDEPNELVPTTDAVKVRLIGIDTPEIGDGAECFGDQATELLRTLLPQGSVTWVTADRGPTDRYGRSLFYLWTTDGRFVNYEIVAQGAGESVNIPPNDAYYPLLRAAETEAEALALGMWGACG